uniref:Uncharacterized protein n=1 Tax=Anguilla anguilla TaxID=7936 RepID=A0A0E9X9L8_ANGAN
MIISHKNCVISKHLEQNSDNTEMKFIPIHVQRALVCTSPNFTTEISHSKGAFKIEN